MIPALTTGLVMGFAIRRRHPVAGECLAALCGGVLAGYVILWVGL